MAVDLKLVKELRERTSAGMSDCKSALEEAGGDMEKAVEIILKKGLAKSAKRAGAIASEGEVRAAVSADKHAATMVEVNIQTDFAARNDAFKSFVGEVLAAAEKAPAGADLGAQPLGGKTVAETATDLTAKIGEKVAVRRWERVAVPAGKSGLAHAYVHLGGKIGVILALETDSAAVASHAAVLKFADDTAMQIAAMAPLVVQRSDAAADMVAKQKELFEGQLREDPKPKPPAAWPKIIEGKLNKWYSEICLLEQESATAAAEGKPGTTIDALREAAAKAAGGKVTVARFVRFERGEGIEKKSDDFAAEVAKMAGG
jgi:elongation factor Ts